MYFVVKEKTLNLLKFLLCHLNKVSNSASPFRQRPMSLKATPAPSAAVACQYPSTAHYTIPH